MASMRITSQLMMPIVMSTFRLRMLVELLLLVSRAQPVHAPKKFETHFITFLNTFCGSRCGSGDKEGGSFVDRREVFFASLSTTRPCFMEIDETGFPWDSLHCFLAHFCTTSALKFVSLSYFRAAFGYQFIGIEDGRGEQVFCRGR